MATQGAIYELKKPDGKDSGQLLKVLKFKAVLPITGNDIGEDTMEHGNCRSSCSWSQFSIEFDFRICFLSMRSALAGLKREWIIGQHLNKLRGPKGELQGTGLYARLLATDV